MGITFLSFSFLGGGSYNQLKSCSLCLEIDLMLTLQLEEFLGLAGGRYQQVYHCS